MMAQIDAIDLLTKVDQFYQSAFAQLVVVLTVVLVVGLAVVGIVVPVVIYWLQTRSFDRERERILAKTKAEIQRVIAAERKAYKEDLQQAVQESRRQVHHHSAIHWLETADVCVRTGAWIFAIRYWAFSIKSALLAQWDPTESKWKLVIDALSRFGSEEPAKAIARGPETREAILETIRLLREQPKTKPYTTLLEMLKELLRPKEDTQE